MLVKSQIKLIRSLKQKKYRNQHQLFFVEGIKTVQELLISDFRAHSIFGLESDNFDISDKIFHKVNDAQFKQISQLKNPNGVLGVFHIPDTIKIDFTDWVVALDDIQDPGNLGTIIRLCDWFGIKNLVCSPNTVDCYNPKVLQATMGSISRVNIVYTNLKKFLAESEIPIYGAFMDGTAVNRSKLPKKGIVILGNEGNGISDEVETLISHKITIPQHGIKTAESLNVATATAILLNEIRRT